MLKIKCPKCHTIHKLNQLEFWALWSFHTEGPAENPTEEPIYLNYGLIYLSGIYCPKCDYPLYELKPYELGNLGELKSKASLFKIYKKALAEYIVQEEKK